MEEIPHEKYPPKQLRDMMQDPSELQGYQQFRETEGVAVHPAMQGPLSFDQQRFQLTVPCYSTQLREMILACQAAGWGEHIDPERCTWDDVRECRYAAEEAIVQGTKTYDAKGSGNLVRRVFRHGDTASALGRPLLSFIPDEKGLNVLRAGLAMLFTFLEQREENREAIFSAFQDIEGILRRAQQRMDDFSDENTVKGEVFLLLITLFEEIPKLLGALQHEHKQRFPHFHVCRPEKEAEKIKDVVKKVESAYKSLNEAIQELANRKAIESGRTLVDVKQEVTATRQAVHNTKAVMTKYNSRLDERFSSLGDTLSHQANEVKTTMQAVNEKLRTLPELERFMQLIQKSILGGQINTGIYQNGLEAQRTRDALRYPNTQLALLSSGYPFSSSASLTDILEAIDGHPLCSANDLRCVLSQAKTMEEDALGRGRWLLNTPRFQTWLRSATNDFIFADGDGGSAVHTKTSPLSVFCATFAVGVRQMESSVCLAFFCGQHFSDHDYLCGPAGVLRSLLAQLITSPGMQALNTNGIDEKLVQKAAEDGVTALTRLLHVLVRRIDGRTTVYCLIDKVSELEGTLNGWDDDNDELILGLLRIVQDRDLQPRFKVMFTSTTRSFQLEKLATETRHISLRADNVHSRSMAEDAFLDDIQGVLSSSDGWDE
ncbi:hypothetical protein B0T16DRAFT_422145 [Cercophora newfieldiana]|uniref:Nephrocystin 3-like N-terminal domain-containing protein n=1 Tax=Cercophora newfieldiana TaxID=92897 RepID=A0AA39XT62_9PEZI|nr:hypothetical protein B0T16DRAFT_422145 [Cercophora newfieldiana]